MKKYLLMLSCITFLSISCNQSQDHGDSGQHENNDNDKHENADQQHASSKTTFVHTVFFWMKEDLTSEEAEFFEEGMEKLGKTPSILSYRWGKPAGTPRDVVDNSYTYAWIVDFASKEDQDAYQVDPIHTKFIEESKDLWTKVQVYDTILE